MSETVKKTFNQKLSNIKIFFQKKNKKTGCFLKLVKKCNYSPPKRSSLQLRGQLTTILCEKFSNFVFDQVATATLSVSPQNLFFRIKKTELIFKILLTIEITTEIPGYFEMIL